jgi:hypothetical protein
MTVLYSFIFHGLAQFGDVRFNPFYFSADAGSLHHYPTENTHKAKPALLNNSLKLVPNGSFFGQN